MKRLVGVALAAALLTQGAATTVDPPLQVVVDVAAARVRVFMDGEVMRTYTVAVGARAYPTPRGKYMIDEVTWNPSWTPPASEWAAKARPEPPGPANPMGRVKLRFAPLYYLHGTPNVASLGHAASHGCVRMANRDAIDLAKLIQGWSDPARADEIEAALQRHVTRTIRLTHPVPLLIQ